MSQAKNILFIMFDQLRWDYLSCYGHPHLHTPNIDRLAAKGVRFNRAYIQAPLCGPSRMSTYTGRYVHSHGASYNQFPLKVGERTLGDYLRDQGMGCWLVGKTHMQADAEGMARLGLEPDSVIGTRIAECGFDIYERDDGMRPEGPEGLYDPKGALKYNEYLRDRGYDGENPWHDYANSAIDDDDNVLSGWFLENSDKPANIAEDDSETPYLTRRGIEFMEKQGDAPWCCHLSYIKPHWPYIVPDPYATLYGPDDFLPAIRSDAEKTAHPAFVAMQQAPVCKAFSRDDVRAKVVQAYMGLIKQCDDQMGVLFDFLETSGRMRDTMIVITSDHGDYLGDHWMGEKTFFHDAATKVPLIIYDPSEQADATRGKVYDKIVECIDLVPTFLQTAGGDPNALGHILEGTSLVPLLHGETDDLGKSYAFCEYDFSMRPVATALSLSNRDARAFMIANEKWKMIHFDGGYRPMLFDLENDPNEINDVAEDPNNADVIATLQSAFYHWARRPAQRTTVPNDRLTKMRSGKSTKGVMIGVVDDKSIDPDLTQKYTNRRARKWQEIAKKSPH